MSARDTLTIVVEELASALRPLVEALASPDDFTGFMWDLGWDFDALPAPLAALAAPARRIADLLQAGEIDLAALPGLIDAIRALLRAIDDLETVAGAALPPTVDPAAFRAEFPLQLVDTLIVDYLFAGQYQWATLLQAAGLVQVEQVPAAGLRPSYVKRSIAFEGLGDLLDDPLALLKGTYRWGAGDFRAEAFLRNLAAFAEAWGWSRVRVVLDEKLSDFLLRGAGPGQTQEVHEVALRLPFISDVGSSLELDAGVQLFMLPGTATDLPGFSVLPYGHGALSIRLPLTDSLTAFVEGDADYSAGVGVLVRPERPVRLVKDIIPSETASVAPPAGAHLGFGLEAGAQSGEPFVVLGSSEASRLELKTVSLRGGVEARAQGANDLFVELQLGGARIVLVRDPEADGFLARLLPASPLSVEFSLGVGLSASQGLYFTGSGGIEIQLPVHVQIGPVEVVSALLAATPAAGSVAVDLAATVKGDFAVLTATVENIGMRLTFTVPPDRAGRLGPLDVALGFRPPNGVGLAVDAGVVKGGGFLSFDSAKGEYAGALELTFSGFLSLKAIGLISTRLPGGQPGFSLLIIITAEFVPGLQLGFGFTLVGVGGLVGLNRGVLLDPLALAVRTGAANDILFPVNVIANAPRIISDLRAIFPPENGTFLIGPMAKLGWGTPTLISASLGVIIEIPGNVVILGRLRVNLPTEQAPLILLQVTFVGALEFDKRRLWFFASLYESRVLFMAIDGEMGLLMDFGPQPNFVLSVGGFHPRFAAPALPFPSPRRIAINIINESFARIRAEGYFAVTSNSVQFGSRTEMFFGFSALSVQGYHVFDALFRFSPLSFEVEIATGFSVKVFGVGVWGVHLRGQLSGPRPWRVRGSAKIELLFFDISVDVDVTFGDRGGETLPPIAVMPLIRTEFEKPQNWVATLPPSGNLLTSLRKLDEASTLVLHPVGSLRISQRFAPLRTTLDKIGNQPTADVKELSVEVAAGGLTVRGSVPESFARAQFQELSDDDKLSKPSFEPMDGGVELAAGASQWATGVGADRTVRYESIIVDTLFKQFRRPFFEFWGGLFAHFRAGSAVAKSPLSRAIEHQKQPFAEKITVNGDQYTVGFTRDNTLHTAAAVFSSHTAAEQYLHDTVGRDATLGDQLHVLPMMEVNRAA